MKRSILVLMVLFSVAVKGQFEISAGMGLNFINSPAFTDYVNTNFAMQGDRLADMSSAIEFYGELDYNLSENYAIGLDYSNLIFSYNVLSYVGNYDISYTHFKPSAIAYYQLPGDGYKFMFGLGIGPRFVSLEEKLPNISSATNYNASGLGFLLRAAGNTLLSGDMFANIAVDFRYDGTGDTKIYNSVLKQNVNLTGFSVAVKLGISYLL